MGVVTHLETVLLIGSHYPFPTLRVVREGDAIRFEDSYLSYMEASDDWPRYVRKLETH